LVFLRRVLGEADRAVGPPAEPVGMLAQPWMVGRALDREIERDLETVGGGRRLQTREILERAKLGVDRVVAALLGADRIGTARIVGPGHEAVVAALAIGPADRMDGRK